MLHYVHDFFALLFFFNLDPTPIFIIDSKIKKKSLYIHNDRKCLTWLYIFSSAGGSYLTHFTFTGLCIHFQNVAFKYYSNGVKET